jgi:hypothetical protein
MPQLTVPWNITSPAGTEQAKNIDNEFRKLRQQIEDALEGTLVVDMTTDPIAARPEILGNVTGKVLTIPFAAFNRDSGNQALFDGRRLHIYSGILYVAPLSLPPGVTITKVEALIGMNVLTGITIALYKLISPSDVNTPVAAATTSAAGRYRTGTAVFAESVASDAFYTIRVTGTAGALVDVGYLYGAFVTYTTPDCRNTV